MLKGDAKTAYMREYMRRRRAGEAKINLRPSSWDEALMNWLRPRS